MFYLQCFDVTFESVQFDHVQLLETNIIISDSNNYINVNFTSLEILGAYFLTNTEGDVNFINSTISKVEAEGFFAKNSSSLFQITNVHVSNSSFTKYIFQGEHSLIVNNLLITGGSFSFFYFENCEIVQLNSLHIQDTIPKSTAIQLIGNENIISSFIISDLVFSQTHDIVHFIETSTFIDINGFERISIEKVFMTDVSARKFASIGAITPPKDISFNELSFININANSNFINATFTNTFYMSNIAFENGIIETHGIANSALVYLDSSSSISQTTIHLSNITINGTFVHYAYNGKTKIKFKILCN